MPDDSISFGFKGFWRQAYDTFKHFWEVYPRMSEGLSSVVYAGYEDVSSPQKVIINLGILGGIALQETCTLAGNGLGLGAMKITRSFLEIAINAEFLRLFPEHVDDYLDWIHVDRFKLLNFVRQDLPHLLEEYPAEQQKWIDDNFESVRNRFEITSRGGKTRIRPNWCSLDLAARALKTGFLKEYKAIYPIGNKLLHGNISSMSMHVTNKAQEDPRIPPPPSLAYCGSALMGAHMCTVRIVTTVSKAMGRESCPTVAELEQDYTRAWSKELT